MYHVGSIGILTVTHQGAACDAASIHFGLTIRRTDIFVIFETFKSLCAVFVHVYICCATVVSTGGGDSSCGCRGIHGLKSGGRIMATTRNDSLKAPRGGGV